MRSPAVSENLLRPGRGGRCQPGACKAACCVGGIWVDLLEVQRILDHAPALRPFLPPEHAADEDRWFADRDHHHPDFPSGIALETAIVPRAADPQTPGCIFLRADSLCALHVASTELGLGWPGLKPFECATYPIRRAEGVVAYDEETTAAYPHADCQQGDGRVRAPRYRLFRTELELAIGRAGWRRLARRARGRT